jgi:hypothetical protein
VKAPSDERRHAGSITMRQSTPIFPHTGTVARINECSQEKMSGAEAPRGLKPAPRRQIPSTRHKTPSTKGKDKL